MTSHPRPDRDLASLRQEYGAGGLDESDLVADPVTMFATWFDQARDGGLHEPNAMVLSSVSAQGRPSSRTVLLKGVGPDGFRFFTNLFSRKGHELAAHPFAALLFPWHELERQVRVEGHVTLLSREDVGAYFATRPRGSQLGAWASEQSSVVGGRDELQASYDEVAARYEGRDVPPPDGWGGFLVAPERVEFWQGRPSRMHDRLVYERDGDSWSVTRLAP